MNHCYCFFFAWENHEHKKKAQALKSELIVKLRYMLIVQMALLWLMMNPWKLKHSLIDSRKQVKSTCPVLSLRPNFHAQLLQRTAGRDFTWLWTNHAKATLEREFAFSVGKSLFFFFFRIRIRLSSLVLTIGQFDFQAPSDTRHSLFFIQIAHIARIFIRWIIISVYWFSCLMTH